jgi:autotransporter-associated beta strand protein
LTGNVTGAGGLDVYLDNVGPGTGNNQVLILAGSGNTYTGLTTVRNGTLQIGNGTFSDDVTGNYTVAPNVFSFGQGDIHLVGPHSAMRFALPRSEDFTYNA